MKKPLPNANPATVENGESISGAGSASAWVVVANRLHVRHGPESPVRSLNQLELRVGLLEHDHLLVQPVPGPDFSVHEFWRTMSHLSVANAVEVFAAALLRDLDGKLKCCRPSANPVLWIWVRAFLRLAVVETRNVSTPSPRAGRCPWNPRRSRPAPRGR